MVGSGRRGTIHKDLRAAKGVHLDQRSPFHQRCYHGSHHFCCEAPTCAQSEHCDRLGEVSAAHSNPWNTGIMITCPSKGISRGTLGPSIPASYALSWSFFRLLSTVIYCLPLSRSPPRSVR